MAWWSCLQGTRMAVQRKVNRKCHPEGSEGSFWKTLENHLIIMCFCENMSLTDALRGWLTELEHNELLVSHSYVVKLCTCPKIEKKGELLHASWSGNSSRARMSPAALGHLCGKKTDRLCLRKGLEDCSQVKSSKNIIDWSTDSSSFLWHAHCKAATFFRRHPGEGDPKKSASTTVARSECGPQWAWFVLVIHCFAEMLCLGTWSPAVFADVRNARNALRSQIFDRRWHTF